MLPFWLLAGVFPLGVLGLALVVSFFVVPLTDVVEGVPVGDHNLFFISLLIFRQKENVDLGRASIVMALKTFRNIN